MRDQVSAKDILSTDLITVSWTSTMKAASDRMYKNQLRHLPVTNEQGEIVGMLSDRDVQRAMISEVRHEHGFAASESIQFDPNALVRDYMGWPVLTVDIDTSIAEVAERMLSDKVSSYLVKKGNHTLGIVTSDDLLRVLIDAAKEAKVDERWNIAQILSFRNAGGKQAAYA